MGKLARFACILTPMLCTIASIVCLGILMAGGTNKDMGWVRDLYFLKIDTRFATSPQSINLLDGTTIDDTLLKTGLNNKTSEELGLHDFYTAHLWNYCSGSINNDSGVMVWTVDQCSKPSATFYFNIVDIFQIDTSNAGKTSITEQQIPNAIQNVNKAIKAISTVMVAMYCCGLAASVITFVVGWFGMLSRWGSCVTTIFADVAFLFLLAGSVMATALYVALQKGFNTTWDQFGVWAYIGNRTLTIAWLAVAFSFAGALFWMFSTCCCSGRSNKIMGRDSHSKSRGEKAPYTYERVAAPYMPTQTLGTTDKQHSAPGYEPYRHAGTH